jgi:RNA polymerase sigma-70 factor, ECF subfamily
MDDHELVAQAALGEEAAFAELYKRHAAKVMGMCRRAFKDQAFAEDVSQEVWLAAFRDISQFKPVAKFSTWLHVVAIRQIINEKRRQQRHCGEVEYHEHPVEDIAQRSVLAKIDLEKAMAGLTDLQRQAIDAYWLTGETVDAPVDRMRRRRWKATEAMRATLQLEEEKAA